MCSAWKPIAGELRLVLARSGERRAALDADDARTATPMVRSSTNWSPYGQGLGVVGLSRRRDIQESKNALSPDSLSMGWTFAFAATIHPAVSILSIVHRREC
jgi:hypothetical protein